VAIVFDVCDRSSFDNVRKWMGEIDRYAMSNSAILLVANKCDQTHTRIVTQQMAKQVGSENKKTTTISFFLSFILLSFFFDL
jgi:GTPase SAR1 family protein